MHPPFHSHSPFPCAHQPPTGTHSWKRPIFPSCLSLLIKCILIVQEDVILVLQACIYHGLIKLTPSPVPCSFSITMLP
jgi:hypothetical protein